MIEVMICKYESTYGGLLTAGGGAASAPVYPMMMKGTDDEL